METIPQAAGSVEFPLYHAWRPAALWGPRGSPLYGRQCRIVARGSLNARLVEFENGERGPAKADLSTAATAFPD
jgi:hypothetical protein